MKTRLTILVAVCATLLAAPAVSRRQRRSVLPFARRLAGAGSQPIGGPWSSLGFPGYNQGYADQLLKLVRDRYEHLRLVKLGCGGETTTTMIIGTPWCGPKIPPDRSSRRRRHFCRPTAARWRS